MVPFRLRILALLGFLLTPLALAAQGKEAPPNFLFILVDDMGSPALSCYGGEHVKTPNINRLAQEGVRFEQAYVTPQCSPTRASLLTGQHTARNRLWHVIPGYHYPYARLKEPAYLENLPRDEQYLFTEALEDHGYHTGIIGKWHLHAYTDGYYRMLFEAFGGSYGFEEVWPKFDPTHGRNTVDKDVGHFTELALDFLERSKERPFFLYLSHHPVHGPDKAAPELVDKYRQLGFPETGLHNAHYLAMIEGLDRSTGRLLEKLDELGLSENTYVIFLSDNGGVASKLSNAPLRAGKGSPYEGGLRVPLIIRGPGTAEGKTCQTPVHVTDFYPTLLSLSGTPSPKQQTLDGVDFSPLLENPSASLDRKQLYWYMPLYDMLWGATPCAVLRDGDYKLLYYFGDYYDTQSRTYHAESRRELYNLSEDIGERRDLAADQPERVAAMERQLMAWLREMEAPLPSFNPDFDPDKLFIVENSKGRRSVSKLR